MLKGIDYPSILHNDGTSRIQTVPKNCDSGLRKLLEKWFVVTGCPMLLNTSLNLAGDTIVETVDDAINTLNNSEIDHLYFPETSTLL